MGWRWPLAIVGLCAAVFVWCDRQDAQWRIDAQLDESRRAVEEARKKQARWAAEKWERETHKALKAKRPRTLRDAIAIVGSAPHCRQGRSIRQTYYVTWDYPGEVFGFVVFEVENCSKKSNGVTCEDLKACEMAWPEWGW